MKKGTIRTLMICIMLILFASCKQSENEENIITEVPENISDDITLDPTSTEKEEDISINDTSNSPEREQEFEDTAPNGITYLKKEPDDFYLINKGLSDFGYITKIEESDITVNHVRRITWEDEEWDDSWNSPNGVYVLDDSEKDMQHTIAEDCEIWILHNHSYPPYQISYEDLLEYIGMTNWDILWRFEIVDEKIITIVEQYIE